MADTETIPAGWTPAADLLAERVLLITGAADGIGRALAVRFLLEFAYSLQGCVPSSLELVRDQAVGWIGSVVLSPCSIGGISSCLQFEQQRLQSIILLGVKLACGCNRSLDGTRLDDP